MFENDTICYISLSEFGDEASAEFSPALTTALAESKALVFAARGSRWLLDDGD